LAVAVLIRPSRSPPLVENNDGVLERKSASICRRAGADVAATPQNVPVLMPAFVANFSYVTIDTKSGRAPISG